MNRWIAKQLLSDAHVAIRPLEDLVPDAILRTLLLNTDDAILITGLDHRSLACNERFGAFFEVDPQSVVRMEIEELRSVVYPRLRDPDLWVRQLEEIYAEPELTFQDELELIGEHPLTLQRTTGPVQMHGGQIVGRLWKFRDVTQDRYRERLRDGIFEASTYHNPDPAEVCRFVVQRISELYGAVAILSIREGNKMLFREVCGVPAGAPEMRENQLKDAYCRVTLSQSQPLIVQDGGNDSRFRRILPVKLGFTRYLGACIRDSRGRAIGTICMLDSRSNVPLTEDDAQFVSMMAIRIETELERERLYLERTADQRTMLERQRAELDSTHAVLTAMNAAFEQAGGDRPTDQVIEGQLRLLKGLLGYDSAAILLPAESGLEGRYVARRASTSKALKVATNGWFQSAIAGPGVRFEKLADCDLALKLQASCLAVAPLPLGTGQAGLLVLGCRELPAVQDAHHQVHLAALVDQVALLLAAHRLNQELVRTHRALRDTQSQLIQSEKLSVVGTLSASVAHDIRNILSSLQLECEFGVSDPEVSLGKVREQLERFSLLAHRLLSYSKPRLLARELTDLNSLMERAAAMVAPQMRVTGVAAVWDLSKEPLVVPADPNQVEHLFVNLILNAIQAMHADGGVLTLSSHRSSTGVTVQVSDTGGGIPADRIEKLFKPFHTTRSNGFGLGLYSCGRIAAEHGWHIDVDSKVGSGTTFSVVAPMELR